MRLLVLWLGKVVYWGLKLLGRRGSALPGYIVEKLSPGFLVKSLSRLPDGVIIITGTNGKTTSTKMLSHILNGKKRVLTNQTGSNFIRGIIATIVHNSRISGALPYDIAVFELDEAYAARFVDLYKPRGVVITNIMRDQMDRFGEIDNTAKMMQKVVNNAKDFVVLNRDDTRVAKLAKHAAGQIYYFGVAPALRKLYLNDDELHEPGSVIHSSINAIAELLEINDDKQITASLDNQKVIIQMAVGSTFNYQNAIAVCAAALALGIGVDEITSKITEVKPAFGRGEDISIDGKKVTLQLVKNPGGFRHALHGVSTSKVSAFMIAINDDYADGRDVSWLWDVSFDDSIATKQNHLVYTSGTRAADMALRLKYDDIKTSRVEPSLDKCLMLALRNTPKGGSLIIYTTYTAMLALRKIIASEVEVEQI